MDIHLWKIVEMACLIQNCHFFDNLSLSFNTCCIHFKVLYIPTSFTTTLQKWCPHPRLYVLWLNSPLQSSLMWNKLISVTVVSGTYLPSDCTIFLSNVNADISLRHRGQIVWPLVFRILDFCKSSRRCVRCVASEAILMQCKSSENFAEHKNIFYICATLLIRLSLQWADVS